MAITEIFKQTRKKNWLELELSLENLAREDKIYSDFDDSAQFPESRPPQTKRARWAGPLQRLFGIHRGHPPTTVYFNVDQK